ncbi:MAG: hypothetical protein MUO38_12570 [Anaerolineales bacterium]|nr:hypothetical protein [Anaerolineales bacterium]
MDTLSGPRHRLAGLAFLLALGVGLVMTVPALAEYLGPDRHVVEMVEVRAPANDYWTCGNRNPPPGVNGTCILQNPTNPCPDAGGYHPSKEQQQYWCLWGTNYPDYTGCSCTQANTYQTIEYDLPEATVSGDLQGCVLSNGWCVTSPGLHLAGAEPLAGYEILVLEGTRNGEPFACAGALCDMPLLEGENGFAFWALSSYGDSSQMGGLSARVDTVGPSTAFTSPPEGSTAWASGVVELSGISADLTSGLAAAEISRDGGGSWAPVGLDGGGAWSQAWDTRPEVDGSRPVLARAWDQAGNLGPVAQVVLLLDNTPPAVDLPDRWEISEPIVLTAADTGSGVDRLEVTIQGGGLGVRQYTYTAETVPGSWTWDRTFGDSLAPAGEYAVMLAAWDLVGNRGEETGVLVIPAPAAPAPVSPEATRGWVSAPPPASPAPATEPPASGTILLVVTPVRPAPTDVPAPEAALPQESIPEAPQPSVAAATAAGNGTGVLWGAAALALIGGVTAYVLTKRDERQQKQAEELAAKERQAAEWAAQAAGLRARVEANYQAIQAGVVALAAAAEAARERAEEASRQPEGETPTTQDRVAPDPWTLRAERLEEEEEARRLAAATAQADRLRAIAEGRDQALSETTTPPSATQPEDLFAYVPSFSPIERDDVRPVVSLGVYEVGVRTVFQAGGRLSPILRVTPTKISFHIGPLVVNVGWQGNTLGLCLRTPEEVVPLDDRGTVLTRRQVGSAAIQWNGWYTTLQARYNYLDYTVAGPGQATWYGAGSQGLYLSERVVQVAVGLVAVLAIAGAALLLGPQVAQQMMNALGGMRGPIAVPGN